MGIKQNDTSITDKHYGESDIDMSILEDDEIVDQVRDMLAKGYSVYDISFAAKWVDENTEWAIDA